MESFDDIFGLAEDVVNGVGSIAELAGEIVGDVVELGGEATSLALEGAGEVAAAAGVVAVKKAVEARGKLNYGPTALAGEVLASVVGEDLSKAKANDFQSYGLLEDAASIGTDMLDSFVMKK